MRGSARGRGKTVCARGAFQALLGGPSTSPLEVTCNEATAMGRTSHQPHICFLILSTLLLSSCLTVTPAPGSDKVHVTHNPADVAACKAVGNIVVPKTSNGTVDMATAATDFRNRTIGLGGNTALVTSGFISVPVEGIAYHCD